MKTIAEMLEVLVNGTVQQEIPVETRKELVDDLMAAVHAKKTVIASIYERFLNLMASNNEFANEVGKIYTEVFSSIDPSVRDEYMSRVLPVRSDYIDNPDKENRKRLVRALYAVLAIAADSDVVKIVMAERKLWKLLIEYRNR
jgi:hypothetical protein